MGEEDENWKWSVFWRGWRCEQPVALKRHIAVCRTACTCVLAESVNGFERSPVGRN